MVPGWLIVFPPPKATVSRSMPIAYMATKEDEWKNGAVRRDDKYRYDWRVGISDNLDALKHWVN